VRFFAAPPSATQQMPWVAANDLVEAFCPAPYVMTIINRLAKRSPEEAKRVGTSTGMTTILSLNAAKGFLMGAIEVKEAPPLVLETYTKLLFGAAREAHPDMFEYDEDGYWFINSESIATLLGTEHDDVLALTRRHLMH
jgi:hypothetical protein